MERKEFLSLVGVSVGAVILQGCLSGCSKTTDPTPATTTGTGGTTAVTGITGNNSLVKGTIDFTLDLNDTTNVDLKNNGNALLSGDIIVARTKDGAFIALAKACTHEGTTVNFQSSNNRFNCANHGSNFDLTGKVINGPAASALKQYTTTFDSAKNTLKVS